MSDLVDHYRKLAAKARADASAELLPNVRQSHLRSAERFEEILAGIEVVMQAKTRNEQAKANLATRVGGCRSLPHDDKSQRLLDDLSGRRARPPHSARSRL